MKKITLKILLAVFITGILSSGFIYAEKSTKNIDEKIQEKIDGIDLDLLDSPLDWLGITKAMPLGTVFSEEGAFSLKGKKEIVKKYFEQKKLKIAYDWDVRKKGQLYQNASEQQKEIYSGYFKDKINILNARIDVYNALNKILEEQYGIAKEYVIFPRNFTLKQNIPLYADYLDDLKEKFRTFLEENTGKKKIKKDTLKIKDLAEGGYVFHFNVDNGSKVILFYVEGT